MKFFIKKRCFHIQLLFLLMFGFTPLKCQYLKGPLYKVRSFLERIKFNSSKFRWDEDNPYTDYQKRNDIFWQKYYFFTSKCKVPGKYQVPDHVYEVARQHLLTFHKLYPKANTNEEIAKKLEGLKIYQGFSPDGISFEPGYLFQTQACANPFELSIYFPKDSFHKDKKISPKKEGVLCHEIGHVHKSHSNEDHI